jgi:hypothetical protein
MSASLTAQSARSRDLCRLLYSHGLTVSRRVSLVSSISLFALHRRSRVRPDGMVVGRASAQLHGWEVGFDCESRIRFTAYASPCGRGVSEFLEVPIRARNRTIKQSQLWSAPPVGKCGLQTMMQRQTHPPRNRQVKTRGRKGTWQSQKGHNQTSPPIQTTSPRIINDSRTHVSQQGMPRHDMSNASAYTPACTCDAPYRIFRPLFFHPPASSCASTQLICHRCR